MRRTAAVSTGLVFTLVLAACGGGGEEAETEVPAETPAEQPAAEPAGGTGAMPAWMQVDHTARTVNMTVTAGQDASNNSWNFNGGANGNMTITVPEGYTVTMTFTNNDQAMAHSIGVEEKMATYPATIEPSPAFEGAVSSNPTSMTDATTAGETETLTFTAATAGDYALVCYVPGHAAAGMWVNFNVRPGQEAGVTGP